MTKEEELQYAIIELTRMDNEGLINEADRIRYLELKNRANELAKVVIDDLEHNIFIEEMKEFGVDYKFVRNQEAKIKEYEQYIFKHGFCIEHIFTAVHMLHIPSYITKDLMHRDKPYLYDTKSEAEEVYNRYVEKYGTKDVSIEVKEI